MSETTSRFRGTRDLPSSHLLGTGTPMCAGCGGLQALHEIYDVLGEKTVFLNAAGCMTLLSVYPFTPFRGSWLYTLYCHGIGTCRCPGGTRCLGHSARAGAHGAARGPARCRADR